MVRIVNYKKRQAEDGREFFVLEITGGIEMVMSQVSNQFYATAKRAYIASTFDEETCKVLLGTAMPGNVEKKDCDLYEYTIKETGETITLSHRYMFVPETKSPSQPNYGKVQPDVNSFSINEKKMEFENQF